MRCGIGEIGKIRSFLLEPIETQALKPSRVIIFAYARSYPSTETAARPRSPRRSRTRTGCRSTVPGRDFLAREDRPNQAAYRRPSRDDRQRVAFRVGSRYL